MRILKRQFACVVAVGIMGGGISSAFAQGEPAPTNRPAPSNQPTTTAPSSGSDSEEMCDPPAACSQQPGSTQAQGQAGTTGAQGQAGTTGMQGQAGTSGAQVEGQATINEPQPAPMTYNPPPPPQHYTETVEVPLVDRLGIGFAVGGGLDDFAGQTMRNTTDLGGGWNARITVGTRQYLAFEGSYIGSAQSINALGLDTDAVLVGNGAQAALRINVLKTFAVQPFLYGGAAWRHYQITNNSINTSDVSDHDDVFEIPAGVGFSGYVAGFMADVRGEYRWAFDEDLFPSQTTRGQEASLDRWGVTANLGFAY